MSYTYVAGSTVRWFTSKPFTSIDNVIVDPDNVVFQYSVQGQEPVVFTWVNPSGDPSNTIVHTGTGSFYADIDTTGQGGTWTYSWSCYPSSGIDTSKTAAVFEGTTTISNSSF